MEVLTMQRQTIDQSVEIPVGEVILSGELKIPARSGGIVLFAHGSGSSRFSPRNQQVAETIRKSGIATLLFDLLTEGEEAVDISTLQLRFDIGLLAKRLAGAVEWLSRVEAARGLNIGFFGSSTGGGAALVATAELGERIMAVVSRGGRPDLAGDALEQVTAPTLLIVGELDDVVIKLNQSALERLHCEKELKIVPGATHLFEEPGTLDEVARLATEWFEWHLQGISRAATLGVL
jgi:putative phosphoribosyl transferase